MKTLLKTLLVFVLITSCQEGKKEDVSLESVLEKSKTTQKKSAVASKNQEPLKVLTRADFELFFPKQLGDYNLMQVGEDGTQGVGSGTYIKGKDYGNMINYIVTDGHRKGSSVIRLFEESYQEGSRKISGGEFICVERDGFKTVALLQEQHDSYKISTLYNGRFILTVQGHEKPDEFWTYLKQANLKILDAF